MATDSRSAVQTRRDPAALRMRSSRDGEIHVIRLVGELDLGTAAVLERELRRVELTDAHVIVVDLRELTFIDTTGIRVIAQAQLRSARRLVLVRGTQAVQQLFEIRDLATGLRFVDRLPAHDAATRSTITGAGLIAAAAAGSPDAARAAISRRASQGALAGAVRELSTRRRSGILG